MTKNNNLQLTEYILKYLNNNDNRSNIMMISGDWGTGKTHYWLHDIKPKLKKESNVYISLYGKDSIESIQKEVLLKAFSNKHPSGNYLSKLVAGFSTVGKSTLGGFNFTTLSEELNIF